MKNNILEAIGDTPIVRLNSIGSDVESELFVKIEYMNPGLSVKDRIVPLIVEDAENKGELRPGGTIVEATSGNTGASLEHPDNEDTECHGLAFYLKGGMAEARRFLENVQLFTLAESLGGTESLVEHPAIMTHASLTEESREALGISNTLIRLSVGIEDAEDLIEDLEQTLKA